MLCTYLISCSVSSRLQHHVKLLNYLDICREAAPSEPSYVPMLAGPSEGVFGWVAANYASGALQGYALKQGLRLRKPALPSAPFMGVFELGGASAQVSHAEVIPQA